MNLALIPLLVAALLMAAADPRIQTVELVLRGTHQVTDHRGALVVADARVVVPSDARVPGPVYVVGGELVVAGRVDTDVVQLAGTVAVEPGAGIGGELRHIGGTQDVSDGSQIGRRTAVEEVQPVGNPVVGIASLVLLALVLGWVGRRLARSRPTALRNVSRAIGAHPVITLTVGTLLTLTFLAVFVFMAFTVVLLPVAILGLVAGAVTVAYGVVAWGDLIGSRLPVHRRDRSTVIGVVVALVVLQLVALLPVVGDLIALAVLLTGVGAVAVTYFGVTGFTPAVLPDDS